MAKTNRNFLTYRYSGKVGDQYSLRNRGSNSFIASLPKPRADKSLTDRQKVVRANFQKAMLYAKTTAKDNPSLMEEYAAVRRENQTALNVAFQDAFKGPELSDLRVDAYKGEAGQKFEVQAMDNFRVQSVTFTLISPDGTLLEEGAAVQFTNGFQWVYTATVNNPSLPGTIVRVTAADIPNNRVTLEVIL